MTIENRPGRPGNLTTDQEIKLQEFWKKVLDVFGVAALDDEESAQPAAEAGPDEAEINDIQKRDSELTTGERKKKRRGLFSRKRMDSKTPDASNKAGSSTATVTDADDKYGQTKEYHTALAENLPEELRGAFWSMVKCDHPDGLLLRFLRARKWDLDKALVMLISTMQWRFKEMHVDDDVVVKGEGGAIKDSRSEDKGVAKEGHDFMVPLRIGKSYLHGVDRDGRPMCTVRVRLHKQGEQTERSLERFTVHVLETARLLLIPPVDTATIVFDMTGFSMANMDYTPVKFMIKCFEANYPESLGVILVHKAPWVFQGIWKIIKGWLDPVVAGKVHFTNSPAELEHYIEPGRIVKELGGADSWEYSYVEPPANEDAAMADTATRNRLQDERAKVVKEFEAATRDWIVGSSTDRKLKERRNEIAEQLRSGYWELDPYVRARCLLDRTGVIQKGGRIDFYPGNGAESSSKDARVDGEASAQPHASDVD